MRMRAVAVVTLVASLLLGLSQPGSAAVSISRAELRGNDLRLEGDRAVANARILVDGVDLGRADDRGRFRIEVSGFSSPTCRISVDDGTGAVEAILDGCTPTEPDDPDDPEPAPTPPPSTVLLDPSSVAAGTAATATVLLSAPAPDEGGEVALSSSDPAVATVPESVTVAGGDTAVSVTVSTHPVATTKQAVIAATAGGVTRTATLTVTPDGVTVAALSVSPSVVASGETAEGTVTLTGPAPDGGATVTLSSSNTERATVPAAVTVPAGASSASFGVSAQPVASPVSATISASFGGVTRTATVTVTPQAEILSSLTIEPDLVVGGETADGTITLTGPQESDTVVTLTSTDTSVASVPSSVTVPEAASSVTFTVQTHPVSSSGFAVISASVAGETRSASIHTQAGAPPSAPSLVSVTFAPSTTGGGGASTGTLTLSAPPDGAIFALTSSDPDAVQVPDEVVVPAGTPSWAFPVTTAAVASTTHVTVTATAKCCGATGTQTGTMTVTTDPPPPPDTVRITKVQWRRCIFSIRATSTNPDAIVIVHLTSSDSVVLRLTNLGDGRYEGERVWRPPGSNVPVSITVRSNFGGAVTTTVSDPQGSACRADL